MGYFLKSLRLRRFGMMAIVIATAWSIAISSSSLGALEYWECFIFDTYVRYRPALAPDPRITVVTIDETDLVDEDSGDVLTKWPLPDEVILDVIEKIVRLEPRNIGLHLYLPPSNDGDRVRLKARIAATGNLIGMEKVVGTGRQAASVFDRTQLAMSDMVLDTDATVRRGLVALYDPEEESYLSWGAQLAVEYLAEDGIGYTRLNNGDVRFGRGLVRRLRHGDGGYGAQLDTGGFQVLMDYRGGLDAFETVSLRDFQAGDFDPELFRDRIVAIGPISPELKRAYRTPIVSGRDGFVASVGSQPFFLPWLDNRSDNRSGEDRQADVTIQSHSSEQLMSSLLIHLNLTSQLLDRALAERPLLYAVPRWLKWVWVAVCAWLGTRYCLIPDRCQVWRRGATAQAWLARGGQAGGTAFGLLCVGFVALRLGWWLPTVAPILAFAIALVLQSIHRTYLLYYWASYDALTGVGNRRLFDSSLQELKEASIASRQPLAVILCDVDWFKAYNDAYGHQRGDWCLERVAQAIVSATRPRDIVARYGGEEFVVLLPETTIEGATALADRLCRTIRNLEIEHRVSPFGACLTLSCGVAVWYPAQGRERDPIGAADRALYRAKDRGRNTWELEAQPRSPARTLELSADRHECNDPTSARASRNNRRPTSRPTSRGEPKSGSNAEPGGEEPDTNFETPRQD